MTSAEPSNPSESEKRETSMSLDSVISQDLPTFVSHLECSMTGQRYEADRVHGLSEAGRPLLVRYDLDGLGRAIDKEALAARPPRCRRGCARVGRAARGRPR